MIIDCDHFQLIFSHNDDLSKTYKRNICIIFTGSCRESEQKVADGGSYSANRKQVVERKI